LVGMNGKVDVLMIAIAKRLFISKNVNPKLVDAVVDWIDTDHVQGKSGGDEDSLYFSKGYRVKNAAMDRVGELILVDGVTLDDMNALSSVATVWNSPKEASKININTVSNDLLLAMFPKMTSVDLESIQNQRPYMSLASLSSSSWAQDAEARQALLLLSVSSTNFFVKTQAVFGRANWKEQYAISRSDLGVVQLWRERIL